MNSGRFTSSGFPQSTRVEVITVVSRRGNITEKLRMDEWFPVSWTQTDRMVEGKCPKQSTRSCVRKFVGVQWVFLEALHLSERAEVS